MCMRSFTPHLSPARPLFLSRRPRVSPTGAQSPRGCYNVPSPQSTKEPGMAKIKVLSDALAHKIAAGEVVERPASVVKELLENALDAGARSLNIEVEAGGKRLIRIIDDGEGMTRDDAIIAFERHATSKLRTAEDLEAITTLGFR